MKYFGNITFFYVLHDRMSAAEQLRHAPHTAIPGVTPAPPPYTQAMRMNSLNTLNGGAGPQVSSMNAHHVSSHNSYHLAIQMMIIDFRTAY